MKPKALLLILLAVYLAVQASSITTLLQAPSETERWQTLRQVARQTCIAVVLCLGYSLIFDRWLATARRAGKGFGVPLPGLAILSSVGLLAVLLISFLPASLLTATIGWVFLWISIGIMTIWALQVSRSAGGEPR